MSERPTASSTDLRPRAGAEGHPAPPDGLKPGVPTVVPGSDDHWLTRPRTIRRLWWVFSAILALTVIAQWFIPIKGKFPLESTFAFAAWYGFACCVAMVLIARVLGWWLKRPESYYAEDDPVREPRDV
ncbi:MAG: hypothetical protein V2I57_05545 [Xanthomonadales bacterium]|nr:hypothetical protein [Xanthomonadales bacterium]